MGNKNDEFIEFPDNYSINLDNLIKYCADKYKAHAKSSDEYEIGLNVCKKRINYSFKSVNENNELTKNYSQLYMKYLDLSKKIKTSKNNSKALNEFKEQKKSTKIEMKKLADKIKKNNYEIVQRYNEIRQSLDSIKENLESYIAKKNAYEILKDDLDSYSNNADIIAVMIKGYKELEKLKEEKLKENETINHSYEDKLNRQKQQIINECEKIKDNEEHIKLQLMRLIAIGDNDLQKLLNKSTELKRLQPKLKISYNINNLIAGTTSNINYSLLERDMKKLKTISDNLSKINKQWDSKKQF